MTEPHSIPASRPPVVAQPAFDLTAHFDRVARHCAKGFSDPAAAAHFRAGAVKLSPAFDAAYRFFMSAPRSARSFGLGGSHYIVDEGGYATSPLRISGGASPGYLLMHAMRAINRKRFLDQYGHDLKVVSSLGKRRGSNELTYICWLHRVPAAVTYDKFSKRHRDDGLDLAFDHTTCFQGADGRRLILTEPYGNPSTYAPTVTGTAKLLGLTCTVLPPVRSTHYPNHPGICPTIFAAAGRYEDVCGAFDFADLKGLPYDPNAFFLALGEFPSTPDAALAVGVGIAATAGLRFNAFTRRWVDTGAGQVWHGMSRSTAALRFYPQVRGYPKIAAVPFMSRALAFAETCPHMHLPR